MNVFFKKYFILIIPSIFIIIVIVLAALLLLKGKNTSKKQPFEQKIIESASEVTAPEIDSQIQKNNVNSCGDNYSFFTNLPIDESSFTHITPLGNLNPPGHTFPTDHIYFMLTKKNGTDVPEEVSLYAPGDIIITEVNTSKHLSEVPIYTDYDITFQTCLEATFRFGHITSLTDALLNNLDSSAAVDQNCSEYTAGEKQFQRCFYKTEIKVKSGEALGTVGGREGQNALDLFAYDSRAETPTFANQNRWGSQNGKFTIAVCPIDYFTSDLKSSLSSKFGDFDTPRTIEPMCGTSYQDIPSTAQGTWFEKGTTQTYPEDAHLALVHNNVNPEQPVFSIGTSLRNIGVESGVYLYSPKSSGTINRDFSQISSDGLIYCFEVSRYWEKNISFILLLSLPDSNTARISKGTGTKCAENNTNHFPSYVEFER